MDRWLNVRVSGHACWPTKETSIQFGGHELILRPATQDCDQSVHINLLRISDTDALTLINRFLSTVSWCDGQSLENHYGWSGNPIPVSVPKACRQIGSSFAFPFHRDLESDPKARLALALYREAVTVNSVPFEFLSYFKILNIFWKDKKITPKGGIVTHEIVDGIRNIMPLLQDSLAIDRISAISKKNSDVAAYLYESGRCAIAHAYATPLVDPDDVTDVHRLSADMPIVREIAERLIESKLNIRRTLY